MPITTAESSNEPSLFSKASSNTPFPNNPNPDNNAQHYTLLLESTSWNCTN